MSGSGRVREPVWAGDWELGAADRPWAGLSRGTTIASNMTLGVIVLAVVVLYFNIDHSWYASVGIGRAGRDLGVDLAAVDQGATRLNKLGAYALFGLLGVGLILRRARHRLEVRGPLALCILALLGWAALSLGWSDEPGITLRRGGVLAILTVTAVGLLRQLSLREMVLLVGYTSTIFLLLGVGAEVLLGTFSPLGGSYRFAGTLHPNHQAANCALALLAGLWLVTSKEERWSGRWLGLAIAVCALIFLFLTKSRSGFMAGAGAATVLVLLRMPKSYGLLVPIAAVGAASALIFLVVTDLAETPWSVLLLGRSVEQVPTLNSRVPLWQAMLFFAEQRPILGYGYGAFVDPERGAAIAAEVGGFVLGGPHSAYMSMLLDLGVVGLALFVSVLVLGVTVAIRSYRRGGGEGYVFLAAAVVFYALNGILAAHMVYPTVSLWPLLVLGAVAFARPTRLDRGPG